MKETILTAIITVLSAAISTILLPALAIWLRSKTNNQNLKSAITDLEVTAATCVNSIEQTIVKGYKDSGTWDKEAQATALNTAINEMVRSLTTQTLNLIKQSGDNIEDVATRYIHSYLLLQKQ